MFLRTVLLTMLILQSVGGGPAMYGACIAACYGIAFLGTLGAACATGGAAVAAAVAAGATAGTAGIGECLVVCTPFLTAPGP